ncbi:MAG: AAA family ATPase [Candidatus Wallbacteria bacterium]|nr:AAA family ATPase [Candidatus Wallbacteria bacterium]
METLFKLSRQFLELNNRKFKRYIFGMEDIFCSRLSFLTGQRGVGKTTAVVQYAMQFCANDTTSEDVLYVQTDHFLVRSSIYEIAEEFYNSGGKLLCLDEIHRYPGWSGELKSIFDTFPGLKIIVSGSSALEIRSGSHDLSRRAVIHRMAGLSFREFCEMTLDIELHCCTLDEIIFKHEKIASRIVKLIETGGRKVLPVFRDYLKRGYFPYSMEHSSVPLFYLTLEQNIHRIIESDLLAVYPSLNGTSIRKIKKLLEMLTANVPYTPDLKKLKTALDIGDERTLKNYLKYLEDAGVIIMLGKGRAGLNSLEKPEKIYLNNTNFLYALNEPDAIDKGTLRETFFINTLLEKHRVATSETGDFLINGRITIEVGGKNKSTGQLRGTADSFLALDDLESGFRNKIPLWLFGFLY